MDAFASAQQMVQQNNAWSAQQAQKQMDFQERMSSTAHQREVEDLKLAGLNPVLSAKLGGASTPSGAMGDTDTSGTSAIISMMLSAMNTAGSAARAAANATSKADQYSLDGRVSNQELADLRQIVNGLPLPRFLKAGINAGLGFLANGYNQLGLDPKQGLHDAADSLFSHSSKQMRYPTQVVSDWLDNQVDKWDENAKNFDWQSYYDNNLNSFGQWMFRHGFIGSHTARDAVTYLKRRR